MSAFLKIDECNTCHRSLPWEWVPTLVLNGKTLDGTGVWRSQLVGELCAACRDRLQEEREKERHRTALRARLIELLGGQKPLREFTFERYHITPGNRVAFERSKGFNPAIENLYLWGACGVGKTHLAGAIARHCFEETLSVTMLPAFTLSRRVRMKDPEQEQAILNEFVRAEVLVLDDLGSGANTAFSQQILQEILDGRSFSNRTGLVVTSRYSLDALAAKFADDAIPSRISGMCHRIKIGGPDFRITIRKEMV